MAGQTGISPLRERLRFSIIELLPPNFWAAYSNTRTAMQIGWKDSKRLARAANEKPGELWPFHIPGLSNPVFVRTGSTDADIMAACLVRKYYAFLKPASPVRFIIDAGANAGYSALFFLEQYPEAVVVALEPDPDNFKVAQRNLQPYRNRCHLLKQAIWSSQTRLLLKRTDRHDSTQVSEGSESGDHCSSIDPLSILAMFKQERISIFKCDIEGAEEKLFFENCDRWLEKTDNVAIEIHGQKAHQIVYSSMRRHPFESDYDHELHYFKRKTA